MFNNKLVRMGIAAACDVIMFAALMIYASVYTNTHPYEISMASALWIPAFIALLDIVLVTFFETQTPNKLISFIKNAIYLAILTINIAAIVLMFLKFFDYQDTFEAVTFGVVIQVSFIGMVANAVPLKYLGMHMFEECDLPNFLAPFVSAGSIIIGFLIDLILFSIGMAANSTVQTIIMYIFVFFPIVGMIGAVIYKTMEDEFKTFFIPFFAYSRSRSASGSSSGSQSSSSKSSTYLPTSAGARALENKLEELAAEYSEKLSSKYTNSYGSLKRVEVSVRPFYFADKHSVSMHINIKATGYKNKAETSVSQLKSTLDWHLESDSSDLLSDTKKIVSEMIEAYPELSGYYSFKSHSSFDGMDFVEY